MSPPWGPQEPPSWAPSSAFAPPLGRPRSRGSVRLAEECTGQRNAAGAFFASALREPPDVYPGLWDEQPHRPLSERGAYDSPFQPPTASAGLPALAWSNPYRRGSARAALADARRQNMLAARELKASAKAAVDVAYERLCRQKRSSRSATTQAPGEEAVGPLDEADVRLAELQAQLSLHRSRPERGVERAAVAAALMVRYARSLPSIATARDALHEYHN